MPSQWRFCPGLLAVIAGAGLRIAATRSPDDQPGRPNVIRRKIARIFSPSRVNWRVVHNVSAALLRSLAVAGWAVQSPGVRVYTADHSSLSVLIDRTVA